MQSSGLSQVSAKAFRTRSCVASPATLVRGKAARLGEGRPQHGYSREQPRLLWSGGHPGTEDEEWERYFQINVMSGVRLTRAYLRGMMERKRGRVVFISSEISTRGTILARGDDLDSCEDGDWGRCRMAYFARTRYDGELRRRPTWDVRLEGARFSTPLQPKT